MTKYDLIQSQKVKCRKNCIQYQYDVLYYKYGKEKADELMKPKRSGHYDYKQAFRVFCMKRPMTSSYEEALEKLHNSISALKHLRKTFLI